MLLVKVLKRNDASSIIVAIAVALVLVQLVSGLTQDLSARTLSTVSDLPYLATPSWQENFLRPIVVAIWQLAALEFVFWLYGVTKDFFGNVKKK